VMALVKKCDCGTNNIVENRGNPPRNCSNCKRDLRDYSIIDESEEEVEATSEVPEEGNEEAVSCAEIRFFLTAVNGDYSVEIPKEGAVIGRNALCADFLSCHKAVSRQHIKITCKQRMGVIIEDISKFGTFINGEQLMKGAVKFARPGDIIKLYDCEFRLEKRE